MKEDEVQETQKEVEQELADMDGEGKVERSERGEINEGFSSPGPAILELNTGQSRVIDQQEDTGSSAIKSHAMNFLTKYIIAKPRNPQADKSPSPEVKEDSQSSPGPCQTQTQKSKEEVSWMDNVIDRGCKENSWFGKKCLKIFKVFKI